MIRVEPGVNRSMVNYATPLSGIYHPNAAQAGEHQSLLTQRTKRFVQMHNSPFRACYFA